ncbi:MAG: hypothetical protein ABIR83_11750, partial [Nakamurella sp.]
MAPIAPLDPFVVSLATSHNPSFLASLGHLVNPTGPHGEVTGLAASGTPRTVHTGPELAVAAKPTTMQRVAQRIAAAPRMLFGQTLSAQGERPRSDEEH